jgi:hypothetical protein
MTSGGQKGVSKKIIGPSSQACDSEAQTSINLLPAASNFTRIGPERRRKIIHNSWP